MSLDPMFMRRPMWDGRDDEGLFVPSGIYFVQLDWTGGTSSSRITLLR